MFLMVNFLSSTIDFSFFAFPFFPFQVIKA